MDDSDSEDDDFDLARFLQPVDDDDDEDEDDYSLTFLEEEETDADEQRCSNLISLLQQKKEYPKRTRKKMNYLVKEFLNKTKDDLHRLLCEYDPDNGLDSDRDTEEEVEAIIRFFPEVLSTADEHFICPIQRLVCNITVVSFIPLYVRLAIEFGSFPEEIRGGLFTKDKNGENIFMNLTRSNAVAYDRDHQELAVNDKYLLVMEQLRQMGYLRKEDIQRDCLLERLCCHHFFPENRCRFLVEWDPTALSIGFADELPLHSVTECGSTIRGFQVIFEYGILYYPIKKGISLLFQKDSGGRTPFQVACQEWGQDEVTKVIEDTLIRYSSSNNRPPFNIAEALITAAIDENVHLDCIYFMLRREPDGLQRLLSQSSAASTAAAAAASNNNKRDYTAVVIVIVIKTTGPVV
ncbi:hypothetical protein FRACYDRAFT_252769 [Fragilariopsis cylindrus CCMP1102]|uniref:Uncharacterized protein n=1 Tax=Fragilariopsis cylindrus CCMP1102 TaxID=635003 RepID=A0A1E7ELR5_9STRA|nr:hypothetical protein FRACYDRAFT_252769 [Fragilariopsis cylindrus CCMP1102]|eukprot:OEU06869.1 hypothetical protein FRACYDRAFT_252769 [Fragilariopsis cylindrus CCMP1102]